MMFGMILIFDDVMGCLIDFDLCGMVDDICVCYVVLVVDVFSGVGELVGVGVVE